MANALTASGLALPQINTMDQFGAGVAGAQAAQSNKLTLYKQGMENIGAVALGSMDGKLDGQADPQKFEQGLDLLEQHGIDVSKFRGHPELAPVAARASLTALQQLSQAQSEQDAELAIKKFGLEVQQAHAKIAQGGYDSPEKFSLNPTYYKVPGENGAPGQVLFGTMGDRGTFKPVPLPAGGTPAVPVQQLDTGTAFQPVTKFGDAAPGAPVTPINNADKAQQTAEGKGKGELNVERPALKSKWQAALSSADRQTKIVDDTIDTVINQVTSNPTFTTGTLGDWSKAVAGTPAHDVYNNLLTIQSNIGFDKLQQMRNDSPTGGALGQVSDVENRLLQAVQGALAQGQTKDQLIKNLKQVKQLQVEAIADQHAKFERDFSGKQSTDNSTQPTGGGDVMDWTQMDWNAP